MVNHLPGTLAMIAALIEKPSVSCTDPAFDQSNLSVINLIAEWAETLGFNVEIMPLAGNPGKANLIATLGNNNHRNGLVLSGHTDTVPFDEAKWHSDPFKLAEKDQRLYGLGSADMKSFFALALSAANRFDAKKLQQPLTLIATCDEESTMSGARMLVDQAIKPGRYAIIGEPTNLHPVRMHKGIMMESIIIHGKSGHSSDPELGANAIEGMHKVLQSLLEWRQELQKNNRNPLFKVDVPTMNIGSIHGGDNPNRICSHCETQIDIRPLPGMDIDELRYSLKKRLEPILDSTSGLTLELNSLFPGTPPFETAESAKIIQSAEQISGHRAGAVAFGTEAPYLNQLGLETVIMGPGSIDQAHQPNEFLALDQINPTISFLEKMIGQYCFSSEAGL
ncbi:MAG: acetylornithine deacetylase [Gammaproteobacteria bacterium]|nr:MAG: acetylornithine deacetylase [Gammaproteobacteria bacterium]RLA21693.1 MAG: acetylornithine deacetylase [Gammaproteobacteria bacterium]